MIVGEKRKLYFYKIPDIWPEDLEAAEIYIKEWAKVNVFDLKTDRDLYFFMVTVEKINHKFLRKIIFHEDYDYRPFCFKGLEPIFTLEYEWSVKLVTPPKLPVPIDKSTGKEIGYCVEFSEIPNVTEPLIYNELTKQKRILDLWN